MDPNLPSNPDSLPQSHSERKKYLFIILGIVVLLIIGVFVYLWQKQSINLSSINKTTQQNSLEKVIIKVGEENIYQKDLNYLKKLLPQTLQVNFDSGQSKTLLDQLIQDSIILQGAAQDKLIQLDSSIYNSLEKNYAKRGEVIKKILTDIDNQRPGVRGTVIGIWFNNSISTTSSLSYKERQNIALTKITQLHNQVKTNQLSVQQAQDKIVHDVTLLQLDKDYKENASFDFITSATQPATTFPDFDKILLLLKPGEVSSIYTVQSSKPGQNNKVPTAYLFAQATTVVTLNKSLLFKDWLAEKQKTFSIIFY